MITKSSELYIGLVIYHVYGHLRGEPSREVVTSLPAPKRPNGALYFSTKVTSPRGRKHDSHAVNDCGMDGMSYNHNRCFKTYDEAIAYDAKCTAEGVKERQFRD